MLWDFDAIKGVLGFNNSLGDYPGFATIADGAEARIETHLQRYLTAGEYTERGRLFQNSGPYVPLRGLPIESVSSLVIDGSAVPSEEYAFDQYGLMLYGSIPGLFVCTYTGGFTQAPYWLSRALTLQIAYEWQSHDHIGASSVSTSGGSVSRPALELLSDVRAILAPYRHAKHCFN